MSARERRSRLERVYERDLDAATNRCPCAYCGAPLLLSAATLDHVRARSRGGTNALTNLVIACAACNRAKGSAAAAAFRDWLRTSAGAAWLAAEPSARPRVVHRGRAFVIVSAPSGASRRVEPADDRAPGNRLPRLPPWMEPDGDGW